MTNKTVVLVRENPKHSIFKGVVEALVVDSVEPLDLIDPESHLLTEVYKDIFTDDVANQLMAYLIARQPDMLIWDIIKKIMDSDTEVVLVNSTLLTDEDETFIINLFDDVLMHKLTTSDIKKEAGNIYLGLKKYNDIKSKG